MAWLNRDPRPWERVVVSLLLVGVATAFRAEFLGPLGDRTPYVTFFPAVTLAALHGGLLSGAVATVASAFLAGFWIQKGALDLTGWAALAAFLMTCGVLSAICEATRVARKRLEAANSQLRRTATLLHLTHDSIIVRDLDDRVTFWNRGARERYGWTEEEALGRVAHDLLRTVFPAPLEEIRATLKETGRWEGELVQTRKDGSSLTVASRWARQDDDAGDPSGVLEINNDITERKEAEEALRETRAILHAAMDQSSAGIAIADAPDGKLRYVNDAGLLIRGGTRDAIVDGVGIDRYVSSWHLLDLEGRPLRPDEVPLARAVLFGETCSREFVIRRDSDGDRVVLGNAAPIRDRSGKVTAGIVVFTDTTDRRRAEEELRKLQFELEHRVRDRTAALEESNRELESFSYSVSHDLRAPVRAIDGFAKLLEEHTAGSLDEEGKRLLATVRKSSLRMGHLIDDLLSYARAGRGDLQRAEIDMARLVSEVLPEVLPGDQPWKGGVRVGDLAPARGDPALVRQVLLNLLENAVKFCGAKASPVIEVGSRRTDGVAEYFVRDNGVGFDQKYVGKLFRVFHRLHSEKEFPGTGIGLSLVRRIVERHGGKVRAEGVVDEGATFSFTLGPAVAEGRVGRDATPI